ncbi:MAG TPA: hypothetical protein VHY83_09055 [Solirubrobacteraceae bacterium]|nr:hypothetical protein [Solirubrobacteraceae bacterium]
MAAGAVALTIALIATGTATPRRASGPFAWLRAASPPMGWNVARTPDGAELAHPPEWTPIKTDPGTASVALLGGGGRIVDYLNVTPKQGAETLANWSRFRPEKNRAEGDRDVRLLAATSNAHFLSARGSCVIDVYKTALTAYEEIACLVAGPRSSDVVVAAAPTRLWNEQVAILERAVSSFHT